MSDEQHVHAPAHGDTGFDEAEPQALWILVIGLGTIVTLVGIMFAVEWYFDRVNEEITYEKQLAPISEDLKELRSDEDLRLHTYGYINKGKTEIRIPIERAMDLVISERAAGIMPKAIVPPVTPAGSPKPETAKPAEKK